MTEFIFATGVENSYPMTMVKDALGKEQPFRRDQMRETLHYDFWKKDFALLLVSGYFTGRLDDSAGCNNIVRGRPGGACHGSSTFTLSTKHKTIVCTEQTEANL